MLWVKNEGFSPDFVIKKLVGMVEQWYDDIGETFHQQAYDWIIQKMGGT